MTRASIAMALIMLWGASVQAQTCATDPTGGSGPDLTVTGGWSSPVQADHARYVATLDFYLRTNNALVNNTFYAHEGGTASDGGMDTNAGIGVRLASNGTIQFLNRTSSGGSDEWICSGTCPSYSSNTWYHFHIVQEEHAGRNYTVEVTECDGVDTPTQVADYGDIRSPADFSPSDPKAPFHINYYALRTESGVTFDLYGMSWVASEIAPNCDDTDYGLCQTPNHCTLLGYDYSACSATTPSPFCDNQVFAWNLGWWDRTKNALAQWWNPVAKAIGGGDSRTNNYGTVTLASGGCEGAIVGPNTIATAGHCVDADGDPSSVRPQSPGGWGITVDETDDVFRVNRIYINPSATGSPPYDIAFMYTEETLPEPYVNELYDGTGSSNCDDIISHGPDTQCQYKVSWWSSKRGWQGGCVDPALSWNVSGDSGGPLYAIGDWDGAGGSAGYAKLVGIQFGANQYNNYQDPSFVQSWWDANIDGSTKVFHDFGNGITIDDFVVLINGDEDASLDSASHTRTCQIDVGGTATYAGCTFVNPESNQRLSCVDSVPTGTIYSCDVVLPRYSGDAWEIGEVYVYGASTRNAIDGDSLGAAGAVSVWDLSLAAQIQPIDRTAPTIPYKISPVTAAPGGEAICMIKPADQSAFRHVGCWLDEGSAQSYCFDSDRQSAIQGGYYCSVDVPSTATPGDTWDVTMFAQDINNNSVRVVTGSSTTIYDCAEDTVDGSANNGWLGDQTETSVYGYLVDIEFWMRASVTNQEGYILIGGDTMAAPADADLGIRFNASGGIDALSTGGSWSSTGQSYAANTWYHFRLTIEALSNPGDGYTDEYDVRMAECGQPFTLIASDVSHPRVLDGLTYWDVYSDDATQTIDVNNLAWAGANCLATTCGIEGWSGGSFPNGCGGSLSC